MPAKNTLDKFELKDKTLFTAKEFIINNGVKALTARKLAQENGYSVGTLYNLFSSIDEIILNITVSCLSDLCETVNNNVLEIDDPYSKLQVFSKTLSEYINNNPNLAHLIFTDINNYCDETPEEYINQITLLLNPINDVFIEIFPAIDDMARQKLSEVFAASIMGIMALSAKNLISIICSDDPAVICEMLFTMYLTGMKKLNSKSE